MIMRIVSQLRKIGNALLDVVYPSRVLCIVCEDNTHGGLICRHCEAALDELRLRGPVCSRCGGEITPDGRCSCGRLIVAADGMRSVWRHSGAARALVHSLKHKGVADAASVLAPAMAECITAFGLPADTVVTSVAMPKRRLLQRGIDHGQALACCVAQLAVLNYQPLLRRKHSSHTQQGLGKEARRRNLAGAFEAEPLHGETILLVDDVMTTGATAEACVTALRRAGSGKIYVITATRA